MLARRILIVAVVLGAGGSLSAQTTRICAVQGQGGNPAALGARVTVGGVVTAAYRGGFFLQDPGCDSDSATSDGIWVDARSAMAFPPVGNRATVGGRVGNDGGMTTIAAESLVDEGRYAGSVEAVRLNPPSDPAAAAAYLESHEGMLVSLGATRVVAATDAGGVAFVMPDASNVARLYRTDADGRKVGVTLPDGWLAANQGDRLADPAGALVESPAGFVVWLRPGRLPGVEAGRGAPAAAAPAAAGLLSLGTYDLGGLFDATDDPAVDDATAAARYPAELAVRAQSIARYVGSPDVLAVQQVESLGALQDLAAQAELVPSGYRAALVEGADARGLDVGLLYRGDRIALRGVESRPAPGAPGRAPLVARMETPGGERLTVIACDFTSASAGLDAAAVRLALADHVRALVDESRLTEPQSGIVVLGHLGDVEDSAPLQRLTAGALLDLNGRLPSERPYTAVAQGVSVTNDYVLVDAALAARVSDVHALHVNVDWAHAAPGADPGSTPRASDHDPVVLRLRMR